MIPQAAFDLQLTKRSDKDMLNEYNMGYLKLLQSICVNIQYTYFDQQLLAIVLVHSLIKLVSSQTRQLFPLTNLHQTHRMLLALYQTADRHYYELACEHSGSFSN